MFPPVVMNIYCCYFFFVFFSLLEAADVWWSVLWTWTAAGSTESSPSESECQLRVGGKGTWWYLHNSKNFVSCCHCSSTLKKMNSGVISTVTVRAGWADVLIDAVQIGPKVPMVTRTKAGQFYVIPLALDLLLLRL